MKKFDGAYTLMFENNPERIDVVIDVMLVDPIRLPNSETKPRHLDGSTHVPPSPPSKAQVPSSIFARAKSSAVNVTEATQPVFIRCYHLRDPRFH